MLYQFRVMSPLASLHSDPARIAILYPEVYDLARFREGRREFPPFGPLYLAAVAEEAGHEVVLMRIQEDAPDVNLKGFDVVGFSISSSATYGVMLRARRTASLRPDALLLAGGVHANFYPEQTLADFGVHAVGVGEGEAALLECIDRRHAPDRLSEVAGLCLRATDGTTYQTGNRSVSKDISDLPLPSRHLLPDDAVVMTDRLADTDLRMAHVMFSRGCPFPCRFCAAARTIIQYRSGASARAELEQLQERYAIEGFAIVDDNFIVNRKKVAEICAAITPLDLRWSALSRVDTVTPELLATMRSAGCIELKFGMESGSARMLELMNKGGKVSPDVIRRAVADARAADIGVKLFVIHGYPGENRASTAETMSLLDELAPSVDRVSLFRFVPLPGTYVYNNPEEFRLSGTDRDPEWDGDWGRFHIHHNEHHWWGDESDFAELESSYRELREYVDSTWPDRHESAAP
ncbi:B12-binding domain-containing radical SAM protein [Conexibacter woesei]|uniref:B12-binding domain-containing radical SAM protein n=1 Tax=Conexibacter woesei TaxID=191495 RepID=UPI00047E48C0|nr:radical SAM protein [Conexibacter woesei]